MICGNCQKKLEFPQTVLDQLKQCPFCGKPISKAQKTVKSDSLKTFIESIVSDYGEEIFDLDNNPNLYEVLKDISPKHKTEATILRLLTDFGITDFLYNARYSSEDEKPAVIQSVKRLSLLTGMSSDIAFNMVKSLAEALGFNKIDSIRNNQKENDSEKNYFNTLGLPENATQEQIKQAYRKIALTCHPDKNPDNAKAMKVFRDAQEAYEILSNPQKRNLLSEKNQDADFIQKMRILNEDYPAYGDKLYLLFILHYARKIYDSRNLQPFEKGLIVRDIVNEMHSIFKIPVSMIWDIVCLLTKAFDVKGSLCKYGEDLVDQAGTHYKTIIVGEDIWMAENYRFKSPKSRVYNNDESNASKYGRLYSLTEAEVYAPQGWHLPSKEEFLNLFKHFKTKGTYAYRNEKLQNSCNLTGFNDLASGALDVHDNGGFHDLGLHSYYWTSTYEDYQAECVKIDEKSAFTAKYPSDIIFFSVRYIKNQPGYIEKTNKKSDIEQEAKPSDRSQTKQAIKPKTSEEKNSSTKKVSPGLTEKEQTKHVSEPPTISPAKENESKENSTEALFQEENSEDNNPFGNMAGGFCSIVVSLLLIALGYFLKSADWTLIGLGLMIMGGLFLLGTLATIYEKLGKKGFFSLIFIVFFIAVICGAIFSGKDSKSEQKNFAHVEKRLNVSETQVTNETTENSTSNLTYTNDNESTYESTQEDYEESSETLTNIDSNDSDTLESQVEEYQDTNEDSSIDSTSENFDTTDSQNEEYENEESSSNESYVQSNSFVIIKSKMLDAVRDFNKQHEKTRICTNIINLNDDSFSQFVKNQSGMFFVSCNTCDDPTKTKCSMNFRIDAEGNITVTNEY